MCVGGTGGFSVREGGGTLGCLGQHSASSS